MLLTQLGLILNTIGGIMIATSFGNPPSPAEQTDKKGRKINLAGFLHPLRLRLGIIILISGFVYMFVDTFLK